MGLDIYHLQATLELPQLITPGNHYDLVFLESEYEDFDVPISYFDAYLQLINYPVTVFTVILPKSKDRVEYVNEWFRKYDYTILFDEDEDQLNKMVRNIEREYALQKMQTYVWNAPYWKGINYFFYELRRGFYVSEVGYQRKGMNTDFTKHFYNSEIEYYTAKKDFDFAYACIDYYWKDDTNDFVQERKVRFKQDFIDKYKEGASILWVSY